MGYAGNILPMIEGEITSLGVELEAGGGLTLSIEGFDALHAASRNSGYRQFSEEQSDSAIVREIAADFVPLAVVQEVGSRSNGRVQQGISDLAYLQKLANLHHFQLWVDGRTLFFMSERPSAPAIFARGANLIAFSAHFTTAGQVAEIEVRAWDSANKEAIVASAKATDSFEYQKALSATGLVQIIAGAIGLGAGRRKQIIHAQGEVNSIAEAQDKANAAMAEQRQQMLTASGTVIGNPQLRVGSNVALLDMGRFSLRPYRIESLTHQINASGYRTQFQMRATS
jgi:phage protein D